MQPPISNNTTMYSNIVKHKTIMYSTIMMHAIGRLHSAISAQLQLLGGLEGFFTLCLFLRVLPSSAAGVAASGAAAVVATSANAAAASVAASGVAAGGAAEGCSRSVSECDSDVLLLAAGMMSVAGTSVLLLAAAGPVAIVETTCSHCPENCTLQTGHLLRIICSVGHTSASRGYDTHFQ